MAGVHQSLYHTVQELSQLQDKHATRPDVFDDVEEEQEIEILTQEITQVDISPAENLKPASIYTTSTPIPAPGLLIIIFISLQASTCT